MLDAFIQFIEPFFDYIGSKVLIVLMSPFLPTWRIYWLYMLSSSVLAFYVYYTKPRFDPAQKSSFPAHIRGFISFLIPEYIWHSSSAWLDVRYFFFHSIIRLIINTTLVIGALHLIVQFFTGGPNLIEANELTFDTNVKGIVIAIVYMFVIIAFVDFVSYGMHYLQHKIPILWEFHKVHHSLEVMHPLSNFREHPIDNIFYAVGNGSAVGLIMVLASSLFGYVPSMPQILGIPLLMFAFNILGYNLRHSHVWLRWPGRWAMVFASPAHHHIHHSCHPEHIDKNFAFIFPCWDVLFRTYHLPETNKDVHFGISKHYVSEFKSCLGIYFIPFKNALAPLSKRLKRIF